MLMGQIGLVNGPRHEFNNQSPQVMQAECNSDLNPGEKSGQRAQKRAITEDDATDTSRKRARALSLSYILCA
jgi:hypothetical protein